MSDIQRAGTALFGVVETEARNAVGRRNGRRVEFLVDAKVRSRFDYDDAIRNGKRGTLQTADAHRIRIKRIQR